MKKSNLWAKLLVIALSMFFVVSGFWFNAQGVNVFASERLRFFPNQN
ncbi:MAG: hypothetical protein LBT20_03130 [Clostridiales bacterium]|jgi:hypothetical protein|nr:hypothetical protein [Clostridiales bacterium]